MDVNVVFECIGYGASRAVTSMNHESASSRIPARYILETAKDPVAYCIEAFAEVCPDAARLLGRDARRLIMARLIREAGPAYH